MRTEPAAKPLTRTKPSPAARSGRPRRFGRWWLAGCLALAGLLLGGANFGSASAPSRCATGVASRRPASKSIETICVGQRVADAGRWQLGRAHRHRRQPSDVEKAGRWRRPTGATARATTSTSKRSNRPSGSSSTTFASAQPSRCRSISSRWACRAIFARRCCRWSTARR